MIKDIFNNSQLMRKINDLLEPLRKYQKVVGMPTDRYGSIGSCGLNPEKRSWLIGFRILTIQSER